jgi:hypothetical protein
MAIAGARLAVEDRGVEWLCDMAKPLHTGVLEQIESTATVADRSATVDMELRTLTAEFRLGEVAAILQAPDL